MHKKDRTRETEKHRNRETEKQRNIETERQRNREKEKQRDREKKVKRRRMRKRQSDRQTDRQTDTPFAPLPQPFLPPAPPRLWLCLLFDVACAAGWLFLWYWGNKELHVHIEEYNTEVGDNKKKCNQKRIWEDRKVDQYKRQYHNPSVF